MVFLISLGVVVLFIALFQKPLAKHPAVFYVIGLAIVGIYIFAHYFPVSVWLWRYVFVGMQRCAVGLAFFMVVMFTPVFPAEGRIYAVLQPLRRQLSILGSVFSCGHIVMYSLSFMPRLFDPAVDLDLNLTLSFIISLTITVLLVLLTVTSFVVVRRKMRPESWRKLQKLAYPFFGLIYVHAVLFLGFAAIHGSVNALINVIVYTLLFGSYFALRRKGLATDVNTENRPVVQQQDPV